MNRESIPPLAENQKRNRQGKACPEPGVQMKLSVVIPIYNERESLPIILERVRKTPFEKEIILVDDGSTDGTREDLEKMREYREEDVRIFFHEKNRGKGAALRTGFKEVAGDIVIIQDADLEYNPEDYGRLLEPILDGRADVVYGSRFLGGPHRVLFFWHFMANRALTLISNMLTNLNLSDMETCYKVFRADVIKNLELTSDRFNIEPEITVKLARAGFRIYETPISYSGRDYAEGKKITWRDGLPAVWALLRYRFF
jgi:glycosyltransferase involved in cell wall biosynthesis